MKSLKLFGFLGIAALLVACGGGGGGGTPPVPPPPPPPPPAYLLQPLQAQQMQGTVEPVRWESVTGAEAYVLRIGRRDGGADVLQSAELPASQTQLFLPADIMRDRTLHARLSVRVAGNWLTGRDVSFRVVSVRGAWQSPARGESLKQATAKLRWQPKADAKAYYLWLGEQAGGKEIIDSGELPADASSMSFPDRVLPRERDLVARLWRKLADGRWVYDEDMRFQFRADPGEMTHPSWGDTLREGELRRAFSWAPIPGAEAYYLYVGTEPGRQDVGDSGELPITRTSFLPVLRGHVRRPLYTRLYHLKQGVWIPGVDQPFDVQPEAATLLSPTMDAWAAEGPLAVRWKTSEFASGYRVMVGTQPGLGDLADSGVLGKERTEFTSPSVSRQTLYVRLLSKIGNEWRFFRDTVLHVGTPSPELQLLTAEGAAEDTVDLNRPLEWTAVVGAQAYRLAIGSAPGQSDLLPTRLVKGTKRFPPALPPGQTVYVRLGVLVAEQWYEQEFPRAVVAEASRFETEKLLAEQLTREVRSMANYDSQAFPGTLLEQRLLSVYANCFDFSATMVELLLDAGSATPARTRDTCLINNGTECHTLVEKWDALESTWHAYDPTFAAIPVSNNRGISVESMSAISNSSQFAALDLIPLSADSHRLLNNYYLDYFSLFAKPVAVDGSASSDTSVLDFLEQVVVPVDAGKYYLLRCPENTSSVTAVVNGEDKTLACSDLDRLTPVFLADSIEPVNGDPLPEIYTPRRIATWPKQ